METNYAVASGCRGDDLNQLITELYGIRAEMVRIEKFFEGKSQQVHEKHKESARNFLHYLALRQQDIRSLQQKLAACGLSSLGRAESHVLDNLDAVLRVLHVLAGSELPTSAGEPGDDLLIGKGTLEANTLELLGRKPAKRDVRIMVTMPAKRAAITIWCAIFSMQGWIACVSTVLMTTKRPGPLWSQTSNAPRKKRASIAES